MGDPPPSYQDTFSHPNQQNYQSPPVGAYQGPPAGAYQGPPAGAYQGPPAGAYQGPPAGAYQGPPAGAYHGPPAGAYHGPPAGSYAQGDKVPSYMGPQSSYGTVTVTQQQPQAQVILVGGCPSCRVGVLEDDFTCLGVLCAIIFFPIGILCCLAMRQRRCPNCGAVFG
ncbi:hypothetical protein ACJMK2_033547 [Sinanodonta woodiana]|uniref:Membrane protein BRI3 n=1 Tax=Sinanodonta woodiana TaxID=1069815 RepID=A0ABD3WNR8_SINWO